MIYCKLIEGQLIFAPHKIQVENNIIHNPTEEQLKLQGWKQLIITMPPEIKKEECLEKTYMDIGEYILQDWIIKDKKEG